MFLQLLVLVILIFISAFFSAAEVAFVALSDAKIAAMVKRRLPRAKLIRFLASNRRRLLVTILIGNNVVNIASASLATVLFATWFDSAVIGITTGVMTLLILIFGEIVPKSYAANHPKKFAIFAAPMLRFLEWIGYPIIIIFELLSSLFAGEEKPASVSEEEVRALASAGAKQGNIERGERAMIERLFQFNDITAEDVMTPRVNVIYFEHSQSVKEVATVIEKSPHTRFPVIKESIDEVIGFVHSRDVLIALHKGKRTKKVKTIMHPIVAVPKQMLLDDLLREFQRTQTHMAVVLDEFGGTEGIATLEDVLEELVGEIADEHDISKDVIKRVDKNTIIVAGDTEIRYINDFFNCTIPGEPLDTIAEVILAQIQVLPKKNKKAEFDHVIATITEVKKRSIQKVKIQKK